MLKLFDNFILINLTNPSNNNFSLDKKTIYYIVFFALITRLVFFYFSKGGIFYSLIDEVEAYVWSNNLLYFSHARFFTYLPGPWQNLIFYTLFTSTGSLVSIYGLMIFLGTLQVALIYWFTQKAFSNTKLALFAALITACFPWQVGYLSTFWNPYFIIPLVTLFLGVIIDLERDIHSKKIFFLPLLFGIMTFFHMIVLFAGPFLIYFLIIRKKIQWNKKYFLMGLGLVVLLYIPFFIKEYQNDFFVLRGYFAGTKSVLAFKWESLKVISNIFSVTSHEISRFITNRQTVLLYFLNKFYGHYIVGFSFIAISFVVSFYSFYFFFKNVKNRSLSTNNIYRLFFYFIISIVIAFFLTLRHHSLRYTVIWWPILVIIVAQGFFFLWNFPIKKSLHKKALKLMLLLYLFNGFYATLSIALHNYNPNYQKEYMLVPSVFYLEKINNELKKAIYPDKNLVAGPLYQPNFKGVGILTNSTVTKFNWAGAQALANFNKNHSFFSEIKKKSDVLPKKLFYDDSHTAISVDAKNEKLRATSLKVYLIYNGYFELVDEEAKADYSFTFTSKENWQKKSKSSPYKVISELSNGFLLLKKN